MVTHLRCFAIVLLLLLAALPRPVVAEGLADSRDTAASPATALVDVRGALSMHDHTVTAAGQRSRAEGSAVSHLAFAGQWWARSVPLGLAGDLGLERFALSRGGAASSVGTGIEASAGLTTRFARGRFFAEGQLGYALLRVPFAPPERPSAGAFDIDGQGAGAAPALQASGPQLGARVGVALGSFADLEARGRALPKSFGGSHAGDAAGLRRYAIGAGARLGAMDVGDMRFSALVGYELVTTSAEARDFELGQTQHRVGLGLRAAWPGPAPAPVVVAPPPVAPAPRGRVRGRVRAAKSGQGIPAGAPMPGVSVTAADGAAVTTDADGGFVLEDLAPALTRLALAKEGFKPAEEVVSVPRAGEVEVEILLAPLGPAPVGVLLGSVRDENGAAVSAVIKVRELNLSARADRKGRFRLEVPPGKYALTIEAPSFEAQTKSVAVGSGEQTIFNLDLQRQR